MQNYEEEVIQKLVSMEDLVKKKLKIYSRLLMDPALAKEMETLSLQHEKRKESLLSLTQSKCDGKNKKGEEE